MKRKSFKIEENTLFVYKKANQQVATLGDTDTTTTITTLTGTTGIFNYEKVKK